MNYVPNSEIDLPLPLYQMLCHDSYTRGDSIFSVTDLIKPVQITQLTRRHEAEMPPQDPRANIYRVLGSAVHDLLERVGLQNPDDSQLIEERLYATVGDVPISGQIDLHSTYEHGVLTDWKQVRVSAMKFEKTEWHQQLNCYAHLMRQHGYEVTSARICAIFRDWSQSGMGLWRASTVDGRKIVCKKQRDYPEWGCQILEIPLWSDDEVARYLEERVALHKQAAELPDDQLPECTPTERWRRDVWRVRKIGAVKSRGNKSSFKTEAEAREYLAEMGPEFELSARPGVATRCVFYCTAAPFCQQIAQEGLEIEWLEADEEEEA